MALGCNIDSRGKAVRLILGMVEIVAGLALAWLWAWKSGEWLPWVICVALLLMGVLAIFESWAGWCMVRAMGFKTPV